jgi:hypothetical protein
MEDDLRRKVLVCDRGQKEAEHEAEQRWQSNVFLDKANIPR